MAGNPWDPDMTTYGGRDGLSVIYGNISVFMTLTGKYKNGSQ